jgi:polysaccharide biosynthesis transport protein
MSNQFPNLPVSASSPAGPAQPASPSPDLYYELERGHSLREYLDILSRRKWWIIGTFIVIVFLTALYSFLKTPIYRTTTMLEITEDNAASNVSSDPRSMMSGGWFSAQKFQETQNKILQSTSLAKRVIKALDLEKHPDFAGIANSKNKTKEQILNIMAEAFVGNLTVEPLRNTNLVDISYQSPDKPLTTKVLDTIPTEYLYFLIDRRNESYSLVRGWLDNQLNKMADKVQQTQKKLYKFGQKTDIYEIDESAPSSYSPSTAGTNQSGNVIFQKFYDLSALLTKAESDKMAKKAQYQQIKEQGPDSPLIINNPLIAALRQELVEQQAKVSAMGKVLLHGHPDMQAEQAKLGELKSRLNAEVRRLRDSAKADYEAAERTEKLLRTSLVDQKKQLVDLQENLSDYQILKRDARTNEQLYQALLSRVKEVNISSTMVAANVSVVDPPSLPIRAYKPKKLVNLFLASFLGLFLGVALAIIVESLDDTIKSSEDLEKYCRLPLLGTLPSLNSYRNLTHAKKSFWKRWSFLPWSKRQNREDIPEAGDLDLVVYKHPQDPITEALRHMETSIMLSVSGRPPAVIMVTSANPSEGKTMVASNLAQSLAMRGRPTVIIDCDLRKPRVHKIFGLDALPGLTNYLSGNAAKEEILRETAIPNLLVIPAGPQSPSPSNLLNSEIYKELLSQLRQHFAHIIIDTPPILGFSDARIVSVLVDGTFLVTRHNSTHKAAARLATQLLNQVNAPIMGGVLNDVETSSMKYGGYQYYNYKLYSKYYNVNE